MSIDADKTKGLGFQINPIVFRKIERAILAQRRFAGRGMSKRLWILDEIQEKLKRDKQASIDQLPSQVGISFLLSERLLSDINDQVVRMRKTHTTFSKRKWVEDAILEKLELDEPEIRRLLSEEKVAGS